MPLVCGIACILRQFHQSATQEYVDCLMQLLRALIHTAFSGSSSAKPMEAPADACTLIQYLELFSRHAAVDVPSLELYKSACDVV